MQFKEQEQAEIILRWRNLWHLIPIWTNVYYVPERVNEYNPNYFICLNTMSGKYEVHSVAGGPNVNSRECVLEFEELDVRTLYFLWEQDLRVHGWDIFRRIEASEQRARERKWRDFRNHIQAVARETRPIFSKLADGIDIYNVPTRGPIRGMK